MKQILIYSSVLLMFACTQQERIEFETITVEKTVALSNDDVPPTCNVNIQLEQATKRSGRAGEIINATIANRLFNRGDDLMANAAEAFAEDYTSNYKNTLLPLYNRDRADTTKKAWYHYHYIINSKTQEGSKGTIVYIVDINYHEGGTHGVNQQMVMNFETKTGRLLGLDDIFVSGYQQKLNVILLKALKEKTSLTSLTALHEKGYLVAMDIFVPENFILSEESLTFIYNPDEIAPYTSGSIELTIAYTALENILKSTFEH